jgi:hypothetical protein
MANKPIPVRLRPVVLAYLDELDRVGAFGKGKPAIIRRFVENGIAEALRDKIIKQKTAADIPDDDDDEEADERTPAG